MTPRTVPVFDMFASRPGFARLAAWGLLTGLIDGRDVENESRVDREAFDQMLTEFRNEAPADTRDDVNVITALLLSSVLGFNLLRPLLTNIQHWSDDDDKRLRDLLAKAMVGLTHRR